VEDKLVQLEKNLMVLQKKEAYSKKMLYES
jgi:hypothetical protein